MTPSGLDVAGQMWNHVYISDGSQHGDVLDGVWKIGTMNLAPTNCFVEEPVNRPTCTIQDRYRQCVLNPSGGGRGVIDIQEVPHCIGLEVRIRSEMGTRGRSSDIHIRHLSWNDLRWRKLRTQLLICWGKGDLPGTLSEGAAHGAWELTMLGWGRRKCQFRNGYNMAIDSNGHVEADNQRSVWHI